MADPVYIVKVCPAVTGYAPIPASSDGTERKRKKKSNSSCVNPTNGSSSGVEVVSEEVSISEVVPLLVAVEVLSSEVLPLLVVSLDVTVLGVSVLVVSVEVTVLVVSLPDVVISLDTAVSSLDVVVSLEVAVLTVSVDVVSVEVTVLAVGADGGSVGGTVVTVSVVGSVGKVDALTPIGAIMDRVMTADNSNAVVFWMICTGFFNLFSSLKMVIYIKKARPRKNSKSCFWILFSFMATGYFVSPHLEHCCPVTTVSVHAGVSTT